MFLENFLPAALTSPMCEVCGITLKSLIDLNLHMKNIHSENYSERLHRTEQLVMSVANQKPNISPQIQKMSFDCSECGVLFNNMEDIKLHNETYHRKGVVVIKLRISHPKYERPRRNAESLAPRDFLF